MEQLIDLPADTMYFQTTTRVHPATDQGSRRTQKQQAKVYTQQYLTGKYPKT